MITVYEYTQITQMLIFDKLCVLDRNNTMNSRCGLLRVKFIVSKTCNENHHQLVNFYSVVLYEIAKLFSYSSNNIPTNFLWSGCPKILACAHFFGDE